jgi:hypothetical protein
MEAPHGSVPDDSGRRIMLWLGIGLLAAGLACHVLAAQAIGGTRLAYRDHLGGFVLLTLVSGAILAALARRFWSGRPDITVLSLGALQATLGIFVYVTRFSVHG